MTSWYVDSVYIQTYDGESLLNMFVFQGKSQQKHFTVEEYGNLM